MALIAHWPMINNIEPTSGEYTLSDTSTGSTSTVTDGVIGINSQRKTGGSFVSNLSDIPENLTISMWFKHNSNNWYSECLFGTRIGDNGFMFYRNDGDTDGYYRMYYWYVNTSGSVVGYNTWPGNTGWAYDAWIHITVVRYSDGRLKTYRNGTLINNQNPPSDFAYWHNNGANLSFHGQGNGGSYTSGDYYFQDIRVYDHALSEKEVKLLVRAKVAEYNFSDGLQPGLLYSYHTFSSALGHPTTEAAFDEYFRPTSSTLQRSGVHYDIISWGDAQQSGSGVKPSYLPATYFSWVVSGLLYLPKAGTYYFGVDGDDAIDIEITSLASLNLITAYWYGGHGFSGTYTTGSGQNSLTFSTSEPRLVGFRARMEENGGGDGIKVAWKKPGDSDYEIIPKKYFYHVPASIDSSGLNNHALPTVSDMPLYVNDGVSPVGRGYYWFKAGAQKRIQLPNIHLYNKTVSMWVRVRSGSTSDRIVLAVYNDGVIAASGGTNQILLCVQNGRFQMHGWGSGDPSSTTNILDNEWHHLVWQMKYDASTTANRVMNMWVDGVKETANFSYNEGGAFGPNSSAYWWLGYNSRSYSPYTRDSDVDFGNIEFYGTFLSDDDVIALYNQRASIDKSNFFTKQLNETKHKPLILPYTNWTVNGTGSESFFGQNGSTSENTRLYDAGPWGKKELVWRATPAGDASADGGWNSSSFGIDPNYGYRFSVWVRRTSSASSGNFYMGLNPAPIRNDNGASQGNPYFVCPGIGSLTQNQWYLVVGHIMPHYYTGGRHADSGVYTIENGNLGEIFGSCNLGSAEGRWPSSGTSALHRTYLFYSSGTDSSIDFLYPRVDKMDGSEPSVWALLAGHDSRNYELINDMDGDYIKQFVAKENQSAFEVSEIGITRGLVGYWPFSNDALDYSPNNYHASLSGTSYLQGQPFGGIRFNSSSAYISFASNSIYLPREKSLSFFIRSNRPLSVTDNWEIGFVNQGSTVGSMFGMMYGVGNAQDLGFWGYGSAYDMSVQAVNNKWSSDGNWHHCVITMDGSRNVRVYVDGLQKQWLLHLNYSQQSSTVTMPIDTTNYFLANSRGSWDAGHTYVDIAHVKLFDKALTYEEVKVEYDVFKEKKIKITKGNQVFLDGKLTEVL